MDRYFFIRAGLNLVELMACITGFIYWKKLRDSYWKWFVIYLLLIVMTELAALYISYVLKDPVLNGELYQFFGIPIQFIFFTWLFGRELKAYPERNWPIFGAALYVVSWIVDTLYFAKLKFSFMSFSYTVGNIVLLILLIVYLLKFINSERVLKYRSSMIFWVCLGLLVFYMGSFPFYALRNTLYKNYRDIFYTYWYISFGFDYLMYLLFALAFVWGKPK